MRPGRTSSAATLVAAAGLLLAGCASDPTALGEDLDQERFSGPSSGPGAGSSPGTSDAPQPRQPRLSRPSSPEPTADPPREPTPEPTPEPAVEPAVEPKRSYLSVPALGLEEFPVVRYVGSPDDAPGTAIQNAGPMASPRGPAGGEAPGAVGNFIVTGHRTSHTMPFADLPSLPAGARVVVRSGRTELVYEITRTRWTSFRSERSLAAQSAPVPGRPAQEATQPMITLSTCATPEDHARGNYWSDEFGNPEHRIDKIGVLVARRPAT